MVRTRKNRHTKKAGLAWGQMFGSRREPETVMWPVVICRGAQGHQDWRPMNPKTVCNWPKSVIVTSVYGSWTLDFALLSGITLFWQSLWALSWRSWCGVCPLVSNQSRQSGWSNHCRCAHCMESVAWWTQIHTATLLSEAHLKHRR